MTGEEPTTGATPGDLPPDPGTTFRPSDSTAPRKSNEAAYLATLLVGEDLDTIAAKHARRNAFILRRTVGEGGFGEVWEALQLTLNRVIAVKRPRVRKGSSTDQSTRAAQLLFYREALISGRLDHPNIVPVYDLGVDDQGAPLLAMKLVEGRPWNEVLNDDRAMDEADRLSKHLNILVTVARVTAFAHDNGIVHRDLKPSQVMIGNFGEVFVMDWGLAVSIGERREAGEFSPSKFATPVSKAPNPAGTPAFMAPEQTEPTAERVGTWTDTYLLGGILYAILTGVAPHAKRDSTSAFESARRGEVEPPETRMPDRDLPAELVALCKRALSIDRAGRFQSGQEFLEALEDYLAGRGRREKSAALVGQAKFEFETAKESYDSLEKCDALLTSARVLWNANPEAAALHADVLRRFAELALARGDLRLAGVQVNRLGSGTERDGLQRTIASAERARNRQIHVRRFAIAASFTLLLGIVALGLAYRTSSAKADVTLAEMDFNTAKSRAEAETAADASLLEEKHRAQSEKLSAFRSAVTTLSQVLEREVPPSSSLEREYDWSAAYLAGNPVRTREIEGQISALDETRAQFTSESVPIEPEPYQIIFGKGLLQLYHASDEADLRRAHEFFAQARQLKPYRTEPVAAMVVADYRAGATTAALEDLASAPSQGGSTVVFWAYDVIRVFRSQLIHESSPKIELGQDDRVVEADPNGMNHDHFAEIEGTWTKSDHLELYKSRAPGLTDKKHGTSLRHFFYASLDFHLFPRAPAVARFYPRVPRPMAYSVYVTWPGEANAEPVYYTVRHAGGDTTFAVVQDGLGTFHDANSDVWTRLGRFEFHPGDQHYVEMKVADDVRPLNIYRYGQANADAVLFSTHELNVATTEPLLAETQIQFPDVHASYGSTPTIEWAENFETARITAANEKKPIFAFCFHSVTTFAGSKMTEYRDYCENRLLGHPLVLSELAGRYVPINLDLEAAPEVAKDLGIADEGTVIYICSSDGKPLDAIKGPDLRISPAALAARLRGDYQKFANSTR